MQGRKGYSEETPPEDAVFTVAKHAPGDVGCYLCGDLPVSFGTLIAGYTVTRGDRNLPTCGYHLDMALTMWETIWREIEAVNR